MRKWTSAAVLVGLAVVALGGQGTTVHHDVRIDGPGGCRADRRAGHHDHVPGNRGADPTALPGGHWRLGRCRYRGHRDRLPDRRPENDDVHAGDVHVGIGDGAMSRVTRSSSACPAGGRGWGRGFSCSTISTPDSGLDVHAGAGVQLRPRCRTALVSPRRASRPVAECSTLRTTPLPDSVWTCTLALVCS